MIPIRQKERPSGTHRGRDFLIEAINQSHWPTRGRNAADRNSTVAGKYDHPILVPGAAPADRSIAYDLHGAAARVDPLQLAVGEERNGFVIWGPEWEGSTFRVIQHVGSRCPHLVNPERVSTILGQWSNKCQHPPVAGQRQVSRL